MLPLRMMKLFFVRCVSCHCCEREENNVKGVILIVRAIKRMDEKQ